MKLIGGFAGGESDATASDPRANKTVINGGGVARAVDEQKALYRANRSPVGRAAARERRELLRRRSRAR